MTAISYLLRACAATTLALLCSLAFGGQASALSFALSSEFDGDLPDAIYATVSVTQNGDDLDFSVMLNGLLGPDEDAHELYFNLVGTFTGLEITASNAPNSAYGLLVGRPVVGGAGSSFEYGVNFGNGAGPAGNGMLGLATFTLSADQALSPLDLLESSFTSGGIEAQMALHVQGTNTLPESETVGGSTPEPSTALLLAGGLLGLSLRRSYSRT
jgi:hypothetical protein